MSTETPTEIPKPEAPKPTALESKPAETAPAQETDWKAEARKWEDRAKANKEAADRLAAFEESQKTEAQKQADALAEAQSKVKEYETREQVSAWKSEVATATGIPAAALAGSTKEEIEAHAETLKSLIPKKPGGPVVPGAGDTPSPKPADDERGFLRDLFGDK